MIIIFIMVPVEALCVVVLWRAWGNLEIAQMQLHHLSSALSEISCYAEARDKLRLRQQRIEQAVDTTTGSVETVHRALADLSFDLWGRGAHHSRARHDEYADQVYDTVRSANKLVGKWVSGWLGDRSYKDKDKNG